VLVGAGQAQRDVVVDELDPTQIGEDAIASGELTRAVILRATGRWCPIETPSWVAGVTEGWSSVPSCSLGILAAAC
jgi:hypothetical protein